MQEFGRLPSSRLLGRLILHPVLWPVVLTWLGAAPAAIAQEVATVQVQGEPVFSVVGTAAEPAAVRARRIEADLRERILSDLPLAPLQIAARDSLAALLVGQDTLLVVTPEDAEAATARPLSPDELPGALREVAEARAAELRQRFAEASLRERVRVVVGGNPLFEVTGTPELRATRRAAAVGLRVSEIANAAAEPPPIRAVPRGDGAVVTAGDTVLIEISAVEAAARGVRPTELAEEWATEIERAVSVLREQGSWTYLLRVGVVALLATLFVGALSWTLRRFVRRRKAAARRTATGEALGLRVMALGWMVTVVQFFLWTGLTFYLLWLVPRTRPLTFAAAERTIAALGREIARAAAWLGSSGIFVALILIATLLGMRFFGVVVRQLVLGFGARRGGRVALRVGTLAETVVRVAQLLVLFLGILALLSQLEIDAVPLLASAGVVGIALGFGVQSLIRDFFTGFFILLEDQYGVGDIIRVGAVAGTVERFTLRITQLRGVDGSLTSIPNGEITTVTNLSKDYAQVVMDVRVLLGEDVDRATEVIAETARQLAEDWQERIRGEPEVWGIESIDTAAQAVAIRVVIKTAPLERFRVSRELRRRILDAFAEQGIRVPPRSVVTLSAEGVGV